jgi:methyl-accepting chemotaxis protein
LSIVRLFRSVPPAPSLSIEAEPPPREPARASAAEIEPLIRQLEDDMRFTMRVIGYEAERAKAKIDESVAQVERIGQASQALTTLSATADGVSASLVNTAAQLEVATDAIRRDVAGADLFIGEARQLTSEVGASMARLTEAVGRIDSVMHIMATIARHTNILALNAGIEAARAGPEGRSFGVLANEVKSLAEKASKATSDVTTQIGALHGVAKQNSTAMTKIAKLIRRIDPVLSSIQSSVKAQTEEIRVTATRAAESARFVQAVANKAVEVKRLADIANVASKQAKNAGDGVVFAMGRYAQRSTVYLRNSASGDRRRFQRAPVKIPAAIFLGGETRAATVLDISEAGALLLIEGGQARVGDRSRLSMENLGDCSGTVVGISDLGCHFKFESVSPELVAAIRKITARTLLGDAPFIQAAQAAAAEVRKAFEDGVAFGDVRSEDLITTDYRPIEGTDPVQYETNALPFYERVLPPLIMKYGETNPRPVYAIVSDRNAYLPVHHPECSLPQRENDWVWNDVHCRNKRIMERWQALVASRNTAPLYQKVFLRHMNNGVIIPIKSFSSPIYIYEKLWGNFQLGYFY